MSDLSSRQCKPSEDGELPLTRDVAEGFLNQLSGEWSVSEDGKNISRTFKFKNYYETMAFANVVAMVAHQQDHHPDMKITYNTCYVEYSTHKIGGLSVNDFICAAKIDNVLPL